MLACSSNISKQPSRIRNLGMNACCRGHTLLERCGTHDVCRGRNHLFAFGINEEMKSNDLNNVQGGL